MIPVTTIGGYLGAGKTTFINSLLRAPAGRRIAVLVNDFGGINIDASLIASMGATTIALTNGCACCVLGDDLAAAFGSVADAFPRFDEVLVEASGVADPRRMAEWANLPGLTHSTVIVLADALTIEDRLGDPFLGRTIRRQLSGADRVMLTKTDLVAKDFTDRVAELVRTVAPSADVVSSSPDVPWSLLVPRPAHSAENALERREELGEDHGAAHVTYTFEFARPVHARDLLDCFAEPIEGLVRAKGFVPVKGEGPMLLQVVGSIARLEPTDPARAAGPNVSIVVIGVDGLFDLSRFGARVSSVGLVERR